MKATQKTTPGTTLPASDSYRLFFHNHPLPMWVYDLESLAFLDVNAAAVEKYGYSRDEFLRLSVKDIRPPEDVTRLLVDVKKKRPALQHSGEWRHRLKDGRIIEVEITSHTLEFDGRKAVLILAQDITERKHSEKALRASEEKLRSIFRVAPTGIGLVRDRILLEVNSSICEMTGYSEEELVGQSARMLYPTQEDFEFVGREKYKQIAQKGSGIVETRWQKKDGSIIDILLASTPLDNSDLTKGVTFTALDITERKRSEEAVREAHDRLLLVLDSLPADIYVADMKTYEILFMNQNMRKNFYGDLVGQVCWKKFRAGSGPCPHCTNDQLVDSQGNPTSGVNWEGQNPITRCWYANYDRAIRWVDGQMVRLQIAVDITDRKRADDALHFLSTRQEAILSAVPDILMEVNNDKIYTWANPAGLWFFGEDVVGKEAAIYFEGEQETYDIVNPLFNGSQDVIYLESWQRRKDGEKRLLAWQCRVLKDSAGNVTGALSSAHDITKRKQAEEALRASEEQYRRLHESMRDCFVQVKMSGEIVDVNPAYLEMLGYSKEETLQLRYHEITPQRWHRFEKEIVETQILPFGYSEVYEKEYIKKDGTVFPVELRTFLLRDAEGQPSGMWAIVRDITERKQAEEEIHQRSEELSVLNALGREVSSSLSLERNITAGMQGMLNAVRPDLAFLFLRDGDRLILKEAQLHKGKKRLGQVPEHRVGECLCGLAVKENKALFSRDIFTDNRCTWEECKQAGIKSFAALPLRSGEEVIGVIGLASDEERDFEAQAEFLETLASQISVGLINARLFETVQHYAADLEQRVEERTRELRQAQEQLVRQEKLAVLGQLAGGVGHELRNPLAVINNAVYLLKLLQPDADKKVREYLGMIEKEIHTAEKIITDLLDFARMKSVEREPASVPELVQRVLERYPNPPAVTVSLKFPSSLPNVFVDPRQMEQVLGNLVINAFQAMPQGGALSLSAKKKGLEVALSVADTGMGISPENMEKLFEPLFTTKLKGIGLGLAVSRKLVEANDGRIEVQSEAGQGSTFTVFLPVDRQNK